MCLLFTDPVTLLGEGQYNINSLKKIKVSDSFLGLDEKDRGCQTKESFDQCTTNHFMMTSKKQCDCLPYPININPNDHCKVCTTRDKNCQHDVLSMNLTKTCLR